MATKSRSRCDLIIELIDTCLAKIEDQLPCPRPNGAQTHRPR